LFRNNGGKTIPTHST
ncbi:Shikimate kinase 1, partial [Haemophilus influenzae]